VLVYADRAGDGLLGGQLGSAAEVDLLLLDELVVDVVVFGELLQVAVAQQ
jgi:hypothetical protein